MCFWVVIAFDVQRVEAKVEARVEEGDVEVSSDDCFGGRYVPIGKAESLVLVVTPEGRREDGCYRMTSLCQFREMGCVLLEWKEGKKMQFGRGGRGVIKAIRRILNLEVVGFSIWG